MVVECVGLLFYGVLCADWDNLSQRCPRLLMCSVLVKPSTSFLFRLLLTAGLILCGFSLSICLCGSGGRGAVVDYG